MREIDYTFSRLPFARAVLAGAAISVAALASAAHGQMLGSGNGSGIDIRASTRVDQVPQALPQPQQAAFPRPLTSADAEVMRKIFDFQARGITPEVDQFLSGLRDPLLKGSVLADRLLGHHHRATARELLDWLHEYSDHADAASVRALLLQRLPQPSTPQAMKPGLAAKRDASPPGACVDETAHGVTAPGESKPGSRAVQAPAGAMPDLSDPSRRNPASHVWLSALVVDGAQRHRSAASLRFIGSQRAIPPAFADRLRAQVAQVLFTQNDDAGALRVAQGALKDSAPASRAGLAYYIGGLAAWRLDQTELARSLFESGTGAVNTTSELRAASAFWASRASRTMHDSDAAAKWLHRAAEQQFTFHGMLAQRILQMDSGLFPRRGLLQADIDAVAATPKGRRAFALLQIGQTDRADAEFRSLWADMRSDPTRSQSLLMVTSAAGLLNCSMQLPPAPEPQESHQPHDELHFPLPPLHPTGGFSIDPALVYALTRLESNFDPRATSRAGARGLMQIMPATARYMMGDTFFALTRLHDSSSNLAIGQRYISYLSRQGGIDDNLIRMLVSYNAGPGNLARWGPGIRDHGDPLLFIEGIPVAETRAFVPHALVYSWIYAARLHLPAPSLDELAAGEFPRFTRRGETGTMPAPASH